MTNYLELPVGDKSPEVINAVIEIPYEGSNKYEYDKELHVFRLDRLQTKTWTRGSSPREGMSKI